MTCWSRQTPWRQGHVLPDEAILALGLSSTKPHPIIAIVVSHDCDIAQDPSVEPDVEVLLGCKVLVPDGNFTHAKNPRKLHLPLLSDKSNFYCELVATEKKLVKKEDIGKFCPDPSVSVLPRDRSTLQHWLAARYRRTAFPDEFDRRLNKCGLPKKLADILGPLGEHVFAVFFDVDEGDDVVRDGADDPYSLRIDLLYSTMSDPLLSEKAATKAASEISDVFKKKFFVESAGTWKNIELIDCSAISDEVMTYKMSLFYKRWNADYISFRSDPPQPILSE
jgi:hypothetical protein